MKPYWKQDNNIIYQGHVLEVLKSIADESVQVCVTSPPYWGLRDYGLEPMVWDGDENCRHEWGEVEGSQGKRKSLAENESNIKRAKEKGYDVGAWGASNGASEGFDRTSIPSSQFCQLCNTWRGSLGLEPTPELFIEHIVQIFKEVKRVLRKDGTLWLNLGDSYAANRTYQVKDSIGPENTGNEKGSHVPPGLKPKDLIGIPWRVALALQADGWYLRSDIIWAKPNPMPESVTDRPTKAHEYLFLLSKSPKYYYDADSIKVPAAESTHNRGPVDFGGEKGRNYEPEKSDPNYRGGNEQWGRTYHYNGGTVNKRTVWTIATQPMPEAHFATFPEKLIEPCILAGTSEKGCCVECGAPWERVVEKSRTKETPNMSGLRAEQQGKDSTFVMPVRYETISKTIGWEIFCKCSPKSKPCTVLDPFFGAGTTGIVAHKHGRNFIGIELSESYLDDIAIPRIEKATKQRRLFK